MKVSEKKRPNQRTKSSQKQRSKNQKQRTKASKPKQDNEAKPSKKGLKEKTQQQQQPNRRHTTNPPVPCLGRSFLIPNVRKARA